MMSRTEAETILKQTFGLDHFYDEQWEAIERLFRGERILMIERTGFGKSLCYQFPATLLPGVTVVFSPLIALMRDQVDSLCERGIPAACINSEQPVQERASVMRRAIEGKIKILYVAPERQESQRWIEATRRMRLSMVVIDEAHTVSTWGHDFRPSFRRIIDLVQLLPASLPVLATTATATRRVQEDIEEQIGGRLTTIRGSLARPNFLLHVITVRSENEKLIWLAAYLNDLPGTGLVYTGTRVNTEFYAKWLKSVGVNAVDYSGSSGASLRKEIEQGLMENRYKCVVSTNALGMGIDKPDIRFVIHTQIPASPIHYYQEIGRGGRDGKPTWIILFYNEAKDKYGHATDLELPLSFIDGSRPPVSKYLAVIKLLEEGPLTKEEMRKWANLKSNQEDVITADLLEQGIVKEVRYGKERQYEYQFGAKELDTAKFEELRSAKQQDLRRMVDYVYTRSPRMQFLCQYLDSEEQPEYGNCDNTGLGRLTAERDASLTAKLKAFKETFFPELPLSETTGRAGTDLRVRMSKPGTMEVLRGNEVVASFFKTVLLDGFSEEDKAVILDLKRTHLRSASRLTDGYAASYYGVSKVGTALHRSKYGHGGDFPAFLLEKTLSVFRKKYRGIPFDLVVYVPPTVSGNLVRNFALSLGGEIGVPVSHRLRKTRVTEEQKAFQNVPNKEDNVRGAFDVDEETVKGKRILLIDDIFDSGATLKEIGRLLTLRGALWIVPMVIAKTVGGTL
ncbi:MAG: RecQ family ATP-dependent DNA helicase [Prevotellaceae bacterium]|nr:RecQ family ATP-dependent DNA helicase [Prevotellaceae bacterium]